MMKLIQEHIYIIYKRELSITKMFEKLYLGGHPKTIENKENYHILQLGNKTFLIKEKGRNYVFAVKVQFNNSVKCSFGIPMKRNA